MSYYSEDLEMDKYHVDYVETVYGLGALGSIRIENDAENESYGAYGDVTWHLSDQLALIGGLRWSRDEKDWCTKYPAG